MLTQGLEFRGESNHSVTNEITIIVIKIIVTRQWQLADFSAA
jgi:hypothetical protein